jgi:hypothetical protein
MNKNKSNFLSFIFNKFYFFYLYIQINKHQPKLESIQVYEKVLHQVKLKYFDKLELYE